MSREGERSESLLKYLKNNFITRSYSYERATKTQIKGIGSFVHSFMRFDVYNEDCVAGCARYVADESVDLIINDPPFGIDESTFEKKHYGRDDSVVLGGYVEAPAEYRPWCESWMAQCRRILKRDGTMYVISGWTRLGDVLAALETAGFRTLNHCIWKYNFGVFTTTKFVTSHYHVLRVAKTEAKTPTFRTHCRFGPQERTPDGSRSLLNADLEDVFVINREYAPGKIKNANALPSELVSKLIAYSSAPGDLVCDMFLGNFTTAYAALRMDRRVVGFEINPIAFEHHAKMLEPVGPVPEREVVVRVPLNRGKRFAPGEIDDILKEYKRMMAAGDNPTKRDVVDRLCAAFGRGRFSIVNVLRKNGKIQD